MPSDISRGRSKKLTPEELQVFRKQSAKRREENRRKGIYSRELAKFTCKTTPDFMPGILEGFKQTVSDSGGFWQNVDIQKEVYRNMIFFNIMWRSLGVFGFLGRLEMVRLNQEESILRIINGAEISPIFMDQKLDEGFYQNTLSELSKLIDYLRLVLKLIGNPEKPQPIPGASQEPWRQSIPENQATDQKIWEMKADGKRWGTIATETGLLRETARTRYYKMKHILTKSP